MKDPLGSIELKSKLLRPIRLSFDIVLNDDIIHVSYSFLPAKNEPWYGYYESSKYGSGLCPLENVRGRENATPEAIAEALCAELGAGKPKEVKNICRNYVDLYVPEFIQLSQIAPNYPEKITKPERVTGYVLFADLRGFSAWSLSAEPEQIVELFEVISGRVAQMLMIIHLTIGSCLVMV